MCIYLFVYLSSCGWHKVWSQWCCHHHFILSIMLAKYLSKMMWKTSIHLQFSYHNWVYKFQSLPLHVRDKFSCQLLPSPYEFFLIWYLYEMIKISLNKRLESKYILVFFIEYIFYLKFMNTFFKFYNFLDYFFFFLFFLFYNYFFKFWVCGWNILRSVRIAIPAPWRYQIYDFWNRGFQYKDFDFQYKYSSDL